MPNGILVIDKPADWTSQDVAAKLRGLLHERRIGHGGTLDPMATGVLPIFAGKATRAVPFVVEGEKEYRALLRLGTVTDTQDTTGTVLETNLVHVTPAELEAVLTRFRGDIEQLPPMYSALKVKGQPLYKLARKGETVERTPRPVTIHRLEQGAWTPEGVPLRVVCSKGTYIRTLCHDIGAALGCGGCMAALRRTRVADFTLDDAVTLETVAEWAERGEAAALLRPVESCFAHLPRADIDGEAERRCRNGNPFLWEGEAGDWRVFGADGGFLMLGQSDGNGQMTSIRNFF